MVTLHELVEARQALRSAWSPAAAPPSGPVTTRRSGTRLRARGRARPPTAVTEHDSPRGSCRPPRPARPARSGLRRARRPPRGHVPGQSQRDEQRLGLRAQGGEVAQGRRRPCSRGRARRPLAAKCALDQGVLRDDDAVGEDCALGILTADEPAALELSEEPNSRAPTASRWKTSTGPEPAPRSARPLRTASEAIAAAPRAASSSGCRAPTGRPGWRNGCSRRRGRLVAVALDRDGDVALAVEEPVDRLGTVPARHDYRGRAQLVQRLGKRRRSASSE